MISARTNSISYLRNRGSVNFKILSRLEICAIVFNRREVRSVSLVRQRQAIGIMGMIFAVAGGIAWFFQATIPAVVLWGVAIIIIFKLKQRRKK